MRRSGFGRCVGVLAYAAVLMALAASGAFAEQAPYMPDINPANFVGVVDNPYFPLTPGTTLVYEGETEDGLEHVEDYVMHGPKWILGIRCTVVWDRVWLEGELIEETFDWYAQDIWGTVWYFGEWSTEYEAGVISHEGSWEAGVDGAQPGIIMLANPQKADTYRQEYYEGVAEDMAKVQDLDGWASVPYGDFGGLLVTKEWTPLESGHIEWKWYALGIGLILEVGKHGGQESLGLIDIQ